MATIINSPSAQQSFTGICNNQHGLVEGKEFSRWDGPEKQPFGSVVCAPIIVTCTSGCALHDMIFKHITK